MRDVVDGRVPKNVVNGLMCYVAARMGRRPWPPNVKRLVCEVALQEWRPGISTRAWETAVKTRIGGLLP